MKPVLNVLRISLSGAICLSLLTACGDGRGSSGFKSYKYTPEQIKVNQEKLKAEQEAKNGKKSVVDTGETPSPFDNVNETEKDKEQKAADKAAAEKLEAERKAAEERRKAGGADDKGDGKGDEKKVTSTAPAADGSGFQQVPDEALGKVFGEVPAETEQRRAIDIKDLNLTIDRETKAGKSDEAGKFLKGITVTAAGPADQRKVTVEALILLDKQEVTLFAENVAAKFYVHKEGEKNPVPNALFQLTKACSKETVLAKDSVYLTVKCKDESCGAIEATLDFKKTDGSRVIATTLSQEVAQGKFETTTNVASMMPFEEALKVSIACTKAPAGTETPKGDDKKVENKEEKKEAAKPEDKDAGVSAGQHKADQCPAIDGKWSYMMKASNDESSSQEVLFMFVRSEKNELGLISADDNDLVFAVNGQINVDKNETSYIGYCERGELTMEVTPKDSAMGKLHFALNSDGTTGKFTRTLGSGQVETFDMKREEVKSASRGIERKAEIPNSDEGDANDSTKNFDQRFNDRTEELKKFDPKAAQEKLAQEVQGDLDKLATPKSETATAPATTATN